MRFAIILLLVSLISNSALSHRGGHKRSGPFKGCHNDKQRGGFHCHIGLYASMSWASENDAIASLQGSPPNVALKTTPLRPVSANKYIRSSWGYGQDNESDCQNTRAEILILRSLKPVIFKNSKKCVVIKGEWEDYYYPEKFTEASKLQIDHVVPLKNAHANGGSAWSPSKKREFANDPENLVITSVKTNTIKSDQGIDTWNPSFKEYACKYHQRWISIKTKYGLTIPDNERKAVDPVACGKFNKTEIVKAK